MDPQLVTAIYEQNTSEIIALINSGRFNNELCVETEICPETESTSTVIDSIILLICKNYQSDDDDIGLICDALFSLPSFNPGFTYMYETKKENMTTYLMDACFYENEYVALRLLKTKQANPDFVNPNFSDFSNYGALNIAMNNALHQVAYVMLTGDFENVKQNSQNRQFISYLIAYRDTMENIFHREFSIESKSDLILKSNSHIDNLRQLVVALF